MPYGGGERTPSVLWEKNLLVEAAEVLRGIEIRQADFEEMVDVAGKGDVVYCDPTYTVAHEDNGFIRYNEKNFSWADQIRLATSAVRARRRGAHVLISNAFHQAIRQLYGGTARFTVLVRNSRVSPKVGARREVKELLVEL